MKRRNIIRPALGAKLRERDKAMFDKMISTPSEVRLDLMLDMLDAAWRETGEALDNRDLP